jgi:RNA polymerase sigma-70 factor (ECF subfamily)
VTTPSLEEVYRRYFPVIRERCRRALSSPQEAEDVAQETFIRFWQSAKAEQTPRDAAAWIHRTAVHLSIDRLRRQAARAEAGPEKLEAQAAFTDPAEALQNRALLAMLARRVPPDALEAGVLHRVDGLTQPEAAALMGVSERSFRRLLVTLDERVARFRQEVMS